MTSQGELFRDFGIELVLKHTPQSYRLEAERALAILAERTQEFTAEDVREIAGDPPNHCNAMGGIIFGAVKSGLIKQVGYTKTNRPSSHKRTLQTYIGT